MEARRLVSEFIELDDVNVSSLVNDRPIVVRSGKVVNGIFHDAACNGILLPNATSVQVFAYDLLATHNEVYTVGVGKKAIVCGFLFNNQNALTNNSFLEVKRAGVYYRVSVFRAVGTLQGINDTPGNVPFVFEAGDVITVSASQVNLNAKLSLLIFDDTSPLKSAVNASMATGNNTIYTCPANRRFRMAGFNGGVQWLVNSILFWPNDSGFLRTFNLYLVPNGDTVRVQNKWTNTAGTITNLQNTVANNGQIQAALVIELEPGDSIVLNVDASNPITGAAFACMTGFEYIP